MLLSLLLTVVMIDTKLGNGQVNQITRSDALIILLFFMVFIYYLVSLSKEKKQKDEEKPKYSLPISLLFILLGLIGIK